MQVVLLFCCQKAAGAGRPITAPRPVTSPALIPSSSQPRIGPLRPRPIRPDSPFRELVTLVSKSGLVESPIEQSRWRGISPHLP